jgi:hypothetical protein
MIRRVKSPLEWFLSTLTIGYPVVTVLVSAYLFLIGESYVKAHPVVVPVVLVALLAGLFVLAMVAMFGDSAVFFRGLIDQRDRRLGRVRHVLDTS